MGNNPETEKRLKQLENKYSEIGPDLETQLEGLLYGEPMSYWDYIQTDTLLNLQTDGKDDKTGKKSYLLEATGGSDWKKYMHPKYQRRIFFPDLWSEEELKN